MTVTIVQDGDIWVAKREDDSGLFCRDLLELAQLLKRVGWI